MWVMAKDRKVFTAVDSIQLCMITVIETLFAEKKDMMLSDIFDGEKFVKHLSSLMTHNYHTTEDGGVFRQWVALKRKCLEQKHLVFEVDGACIFIAQRAFNQEKLGLMRNSTCLLQPSSASTVALPIIYSFLFTTGSFGNILSCWILSKHMATKRTQNIYLTNLVIANLLVCSTMPFLAAYFADGYQWAYESMLCKIVIYFGTPIMHTSMYVSITILCWSAVSQYATLMKYNDHTQYSASVNENFFYKCLLDKFRQPKFAKYLCISIWTIVLGVVVPVIIYDYTFQSNEEQIDRCYHWKTEYGELTAKIIFVIATAWFFLFFITVLISYYSLVNHLRKIQKNTCIRKKHLIYSRVKRNIFVIQLILTICFLPYHIFKPIFYALPVSEDCQRMNYLVEIKNFLICLAAAKSSSDTVVNVLLYKTYKKSLYNLFRKFSSQHEKHTAAKEKTTRL